ncbi:MAG: hypothetical protein ABR604_09370 [Jatrophihabitantaceae bacterium]|nr:hypothetical protein [Chloroflexota bacterium]
MSYPPPTDPPPYSGQLPAGPQGEPQYRAEPPPPYPPAQYAQPAQYPPAQYAQPVTGYGYRLPKQRHVSEPLVGWLLLGSGVLLMVSAAMPWATVLTYSVAGTVGGGKITLAFGLALAVFGVLIGVRQGLLWVSITSCVLALLAVLVALGNMANISSVASSRNLAFLGQDAVAIGAGLWLTLVASLAALTLSIIGIARRSVPNL